MINKLYLSAEEAAEYANVSVKFVYECLNSINPPPYLKLGKKRLIQAAKWPDYLESLQEVRL